MAKNTKLPDSLTLTAKVLPPTEQLDITKLNPADFSSFIRGMGQAQKKALRILHTTGNRGRIS